jgi:lipopolysaccharide assembly outer membrane protein LptD (OstA)
MKLTSSRLPPAAALFALALCAPFAQETGPAAAEAATSAASPASGESSLAEAMKKLFGDTGFQRLQSEEFVYSTDGQVRATGNVILKTRQLGLEGNSLFLNPDTNLMTATGSPVRIRQGEVNAECRKFTFDLQKKQSILEDNPVVFQKADDQVTRLTADKIILTQDADGKTGIHMKMDPKNPKGPTVIEVLPTTDSKKLETPKESTEPKKINGSQDIKLIKLPGTD